MVCFARQKKPAVIDVGDEAAMYDEVRPWTSSIPTLEEVLYDPGWPYKVITAALTNPLSLGLADLCDACSELDPPSRDRRQCSLMYCCVVNKHIYIPMCT